MSSCLASFRYCSDQCGIDVASLTFAEREQKRVQDALEEAQRGQQERLARWTAAHPDVLSECSPSEATRHDLELILAAMKEAEIVRGGRLPQFLLGSSLFFSQLFLCRSNSFLCLVFVKRARFYSLFLGSRATG